MIKKKKKKEQKKKKKKKTELRAQIENREQSLSGITDLTVCTSYLIHWGFVVCNR